MHSQEGDHALRLTSVESSPSRRREALRQTSTGICLADSEVARAIQLVKDFGADNVFIISKAGPTMADLSRQWLTDTMVIGEITGFKLENIHFCPTRAGPRGKGVIARKLGITNIVDDHDDALKDVYLAQSENGAVFHYVGNCSMSPLLSTAVRPRASTGRKRIVRIV